MKIIKQLAIQEFIRGNNISYCLLYKSGRKRSPVFKTAIELRKWAKTNLPENYWLI